MFLLSADSGLFLAEATHSFSANISLRDKSNGKNIFASQMFCAFKQTSLLKALTASMVL